MNLASVLKSRFIQVAAVVIAGGIGADLAGAEGTGGLAVVLVVLAIIVRLLSGPATRAIAGLRISIRWKITAAVGLLGAFFVAMAIMNVLAMEYMHDELHQMQEIGAGRPGELAAAIDDLEATQHGAFFSLTPLFVMAGALTATLLGIAISVSIIEPVRRMSAAMRRIAAGDFSQPVTVHNRDELGDLAARINATAADLARLQQLTMEEERARAMRERAAQVAAAQEDERLRISRELHDGLGPALAALANRLRECHDLVATDTARAAEGVAEVEAELRVRIREIRDLINGLRPLTLDQLGLVGALRSLSERFAAETGVEMLLLLAPDVRLGSIGEVAAFRTAQESLANVRKHARASRVELRLRASGAEVELRVRDDGTGFEPAAPRAGVGLGGMQERAELAGGRLRIESRPGAGCEVTLTLPAAPEARSEEAQRLEDAVGAGPRSAR